MSTATIAGGTVHKMPADLEKALLSHEPALELWNNITPLARNEWICWVEEAKKTETRTRRITVGMSKLTSGMRRPCCWVGCIHRERTGK